MRTAQDIYESYRIFPALQMHQLRVAAVGKTICDALLEDVDTSSVILACLFHDMGNIIKSDFTAFPEFCEPEGIAHWELVKKEFIETYGPDEHKATLIIAREIGLPEDVIEHIDGIGFSKLERTRDDDSFESKIVEYADTRVAPHGVVSQEGRMYDARERYKHVPREVDRFDELFAAAREIERQIFGATAMSPEDITEASIQPLIDKLRSTEVA
jgi:5'-deoxynucleotidase YfbR-like HD superfamily hydrolase